MEAATLAAAEHVKRERDKAEAELLAAYHNARQELEEARGLAYELACAYDTEAVLSASEWQLNHETGRAERQQKNF